MLRSHALRPQFDYLTGSTRALDRIWRLYGVTTLRPGRPDPDRTPYGLLLDRAGKTRVLFDALAKRAAMTHDLGVLLRWRLRRTRRLVPSGVHPSRSTRTARTRAWRWTRTAASET